MIPEGCNKLGFCIPVMPHGFPIKQALLLRLVPTGFHALKICAARWNSCQSGCRMMEKLVSLARLFVNLLASTILFGGGGEELNLEPWEGKPGGNPAP